MEVMSTHTEDELSVEEDLDLDMLVYGQCFWKLIDGKKVRVHPKDVRIVKGEARDSTNSAVSNKVRV